MKRFTIYDPVSKKYGVMFKTKAQAISYITTLKNIYKEKKNLPKYGNGRWHVKRRNYLYDYCHRIVIREFKLTFVQEFKD